MHVHVRRPHAVVHPQRHARVPVRREERIELLAGVGHALLELVAGDEQRHAGGARHLDHALDVGEELGLADARDVLQRGAAAGEHTHQRRELGVVGLAARHRSVVAIGVHHRGRQPDRAGRERVVEHRAQLLALGRGGGPVPCRVAHHPGAQELVGEEPDGVDRSAVLGGDGAVLPVGLPRPRDREPERLGGDVLDEREQFDDGVAVGGAQRRQAETAVRHDQRGAPVRGHRVAVGIPPHRGVEVGVRLDQPGRHVGAPGVDDALAVGREVGADLGDQAVVHTHVGPA